MLLTRISNSRKEMITSQSGNDDAKRNDHKMGHLVNIEIEPRNVERGTI